MSNWGQAIQLVSLGYITVNYKNLRGAFKLKNVPKYGKSPKGGEGLAQKIKKSKFEIWTF